MPKNLVDVSSWIDVAVPVGTDPATAASVEVTFQILADRTRHLLDRLRAALGVALVVARQGVTGGMPGAAWVTGGVVDAGVVLWTGQCFCAIDEDGNAIFTDDYGEYLSDQPGGFGNWMLETGWAGGGGKDPGSMTVPWTAGATMVDAAAELTTGARIAVSDSATGQVALSPNVGTWAAVTPATGSVAWGACAGGPVTQKWVIGGDGGEIDSSANGSVWTARTSGLAASPILCMGHNQLTGGDAVYMALTGAEVSTSADGITWVASSHGLTAAPRALAYSDGRWIAVLEDGGVGYSDDDGGTWTEVTGALGGWQASGTYKNASIAGGAGLLLAHLSSTTEERLWLSADNGETWHRVHVAAGYNDGSVALGVAFGCPEGAYADGELEGFVTVGSSRATCSGAYLPVTA